MADLLPPPFSAPAQAKVPTPLIGVFDSGLGGLSVLGALRARRLDPPLLYVADSGNAPYGERTDDFVIERSMRIAHYLLDRGASLLVMACNTATAVAAAELRKRWPWVPIIGVEPAIKPAVQASPGGRIGVMATPITLRSDKFKRLLDAHGRAADILLQPCPGLATLIEQGNLDAPALLTLIQSHCLPLTAAGVDTVVLGCTHYPFVQHHIQAAMGPQVRLIDTAEAVARHTLKRLDELLPPLPSYKGSSERPVQLMTTGDVAHLDEVAKRWLAFPCEVAFAPTL